MLYVINKGHCVCDCSELKTRQWNHILLKYVLKKMKKSYELLCSLPALIRRTCALKCFCD